MPHPSLSSRFEHPNNTGGGGEIIKWVSVITAWRVLRLQMEERLPVWRVKIKCTLVQVLRLCTGRTTHRGCRGIALLFHDHGISRG